MTNLARSWRKIIGNVGWWLDIVYPLGLALLLAYILTSVMYSDRKHRRIASFWENQLLKISLQIAGDPNVQADDVVAISFTEDDIKTYGQVSETGMLDASIATYANVLTKIAASQPRSVMLSWTPGAHQSTENNYAPLVSSIAQQQLKGLLVGYPQGKAWSVPESFASSITPVSDLSCQEPIEMICPYVPTMRDWAVQRIFDESTNGQLTPESSPSISPNLTLPQPSYILYLASREQIPTVTFSEILGDAFDVQRLNGKTIFIGSNIVQPQIIGDQVDLIRRVFTVHDDYVDDDLRVQGTPMHLFWASLAQQLHGNKMIPVTPLSGTIALAVAVCLLLWVTIARSGPTAALALYLAFALLMPLLNATGIRQGWYYIPIFDSYYAGIMALIFASFVRLSYTTFTRWKSVADSRLQVRTRDLKENFVSMFSHNLNTPIAKVLGTLDIMTHQGIPQTHQDDLKACLLTATQMQLLVRSALISAAARETSLNKENLTIASLRQELVTTLPQVARRLGYQLNFASVLAPDDEFLPIQCDRRAITTLLSSLLAIASNEHKDLAVQLGLEAIESDQPGSRNVRLKLHGHAWGEISDPSVTTNDARNEEFFVSVLRQTCDEVLRSYRAHVTNDVDTTIIDLSCRATL